MNSYVFNLNGCNIRIAARSVTAARHAARQLLALPVETLARFAMEDF